MGKDPGVELRPPGRRNRRGMRIVLPVILDLERVGALVEILHGKPGALEVLLERRVDLEVQVAIGVAVARRCHVLATPLNNGGGAILVRLLVHLGEPLRDGARAGEVDGDGLRLGKAGDSQNQAEREAEQKACHPGFPLSPREDPATRGHCSGPSVSGHKPGLHINVSPLSLRKTFSS